MDDVVTSSTPEQAQHALLLFYDLLPAEMWEAGKKPSVANIQALAERIEESATEEVLSFLNTLHSEAADRTKAEAARMILDRFAQQEVLRPFVEEAVAKASVPYMAPIPPEIVEFVIALALLSARIKVRGFTFEGRAVELVHELTRFVKAWREKVV